jgi:hypothetical protein
MSGAATALLIVLQAPQGSGKTTVAEYVAKAFSCDRIYDDELDHFAITADLYHGLRILVCASDDYAPADDAVPVLHLRIDGDRPADTLCRLLTALGQSGGCEALQRIVMSSASRSTTQEEAS